jgi:ribosomal protein S18 acetylase RimI-like enzyme
MVRIPVINRSRVNDMNGMNTWYVRERHDDSELFTVRAYTSDAHADGSVFEASSPELSELSDALKAYEISPEGPGSIARLRLEPWTAPGAPDVWFCWVDEPARVGSRDATGTPSKAAANLVAFANDRLPAGTIVSSMQFPTLGVSSAEQAGALRWYRDGGTIHQIYVGERYRRMHLGTALLYAASALHQANGWPGFLRGDGRRTDLGSRFAAGLRHPQRVAPLTELMPDMD